MRKINSKFRTEFLSEAGSRLKNKDYFAYVELDNFACYVLADGLDEDIEQNSGELVVESIIKCFTESPSFRKRAIKKYLNIADRELKKESKGWNLKASVLIVITDYRKVRFVSVGNTRFYLYRNERILKKSTDQSLTRRLVETESVAEDKASLHEERNNLYSFIGNEKGYRPDISKKIKLMDGDNLLFLTRGIWEYCDDGELADSCQEAKEPKEILNNVEDLILSKQPDNVDNYTICATFVDKTYRKPNKKWTAKKIILTALPFVIILTILIIVLLVMRHNRITRTESMKEYMAAASNYADHNNFEKSSEEYKEALKLAKKLKNKKKIEEINENKAYADQIVMADETMNTGEYEKAVKEYETALDLSKTQGTVGKDYVEDQLKAADSYMEIYDLLKQGDDLLELEDEDGAKEKYTEAKNLAAEVFFQPGRDEAVAKIKELDQKKAEAAKEKKAADEKAKEEEEKQAEEEKKAEEEEKKAQEEEAAQKEEEEAKKAEEAEKKKAEEEEARQKLAEEKMNALEIEKKGNDAFDIGDYDSAKLYYITARDSYKELKMTTQVKSVEQKIKLSDQKKKEQKARLSDAASYESTAEDMVGNQQYTEAKLMYSLAKDIYEDNGMTDNVKKLEEKIAAIEEITAE